MNSLEKHALEIEQQQRFLDSMFVVIQNTSSELVKDILSKEFVVVDKQKHASFKSFMENII